MRYDFFHKTESNCGRHQVKIFTMILPTRSAAEALQLAYANGLPKGSFRCGCFEIQSDEGIYSHKEDKRLDFNRPDKFTFTPWDN